MPPRRRAVTPVLGVLGVALVLLGGMLATRQAVPAGTSNTDRAGASAPYDLGPAVLLQPMPSRDQTESSSVAAVPAHPAKGAPLRVVVPSLGVDAPVVGIDAPGGVLTPPDDPQVLGWWRSGAQPGAKRGSALITGHTVSSGGGAFDDLETLGRGDRVTIGTADGRIGYRVTGVTIYRKASLAEHAARVFSQEVPGRLVLVTCEDWNGTTYLSNAVVTASPVR